MKTFSAVEAKNKFGELMDTVQREPVSIEKHGRAVAVMVSETEYEEMKLARLQGILTRGEEQIAKGDYEDLSTEELRDKIEAGLEDII